MFDWVISDTHFFHKNIAEYAGRPENHNELIIKNWLNSVMPGRSILHLGDVLMGRQIEWASLLNLGLGHSFADGKAGDVYVLDSGNHDEKHKRRWLEENLGWKFIPEFQIFYQGYAVFFTHYPKGTILPPDAKRNTEVEIRDRLLPHMLNVHGHIHERALPDPQFINVCVEQTNYSPVRLEELLDSRIKVLEGR